MNVNVFAAVQEGIWQLLIVSEPRLWAIARQELVIIASILLAVYGYRLLFGGHSTADAMTWAFATLLFRISVAFAILSFWDVPIPGVGASFPNVISDSALAISRILDLSIVERTTSDLDQLQQKIIAPSVFAVGSGLIYSLIQALILIAKALTSIVSAFGLIAAAVVRLFGPLTVPMMLIPALDYLWWGFLRSFIAFSLYPAFGYAYLLVMEVFLARVVAGMPDAITPEMYTVAGFQIAVDVLVFAIGILFVPTIAQSVLGGAPTSGATILAAGVTAAGRVKGR